MVGFHMVEQLRRSHWIVTVASRPATRNGIRDMRLEKMMSKKLKVVQFRLTVLPFARIYWI